MDRMMLKVAQWIAATGVALFCLCLCMIALSGGTVLLCPVARYCRLKPAIPEAGLLCRPSISTIASWRAIVVRWHATAGLSLPSL